jgi:hypothetical protein
MGQLDLFREERLEQIRKLQRMLADIETPDIRLERRPRPSNVIYLKEKHA